MKTPEFGDIIITNNDERWICADSQTIFEKVGSTPNVIYKQYPIKAYSADLEKFSFMVWKSVDSAEESWKYRIKEVISKKGRPHTDIIKAWADGADVEKFIPLTEKWVFVSQPSWREEVKYRIKTTKELVCHINSDGEIVSVGSGNLSLTFNNLGELISAEVIKK